MYLNYIPGANTLYSHQIWVLFFSSFFLELHLVSERLCGVFNEVLKENSSTFTNASVMNEWQNQLSQ